MYKDNSQLRMEDFIFPYGKLDPENDWVKLAALVPWEIAEERYAAADSAAAEMQRPMAGEAHWRKPVSAIFHRHEGVRAVSVRGVHAGSVPETVQRGGPGSNSGGVCPKSGDRETVSANDKMKENAEEKM